MDKILLLMMDFLYKKNFFLTFNKFIIHNLKVFRFSNSKIINRKKSVVLIELARFPSYILSTSYFIESLRRIVGSDSVSFFGYYPILIKSIFSYIKIFTYILNPFSHFKLYNSFGVNKLLLLRSNKELRILIEKRKSNIINKIKSKKDLINLRINNIYIGDIFYDNYLRFNYKSTVDVSSKKFIKEFSNYIDLFFIWENFFKKNKVNYLIVSHCVYNLAIPVRIGLFRGVNCYLVGITKCIKLDKSGPFDGTAKQNREIFEYSKISKSKIYNITKKKLDEKIDPKSNHYSEANLISRVRKNKVFHKTETSYKLIKNNKPNVVIFSHCYYDAPHNNGSFLFYDYFEWILYLGELSKKTDYNWYLKPHPHNVNNKLNIQQNNFFLNKYSNFNLIPSNVNNFDIINSKTLDCGLTVTGSVAYELALYSIPTILAGKSLFHKGYNFCSQPRNLAEYKNLIINIKNVNTIKKIKKNEIYEFYYSTYLTSWQFLDNYEILMKELNFSLEKYQLLHYWIKNFKIKKHNKLILELINFINSKKLKLVTEKLI